MDEPSLRRPAREALENAPAAERPASRVEDGVKVYGTGSTAVRALDGITVDFPRGGFTAVMGPSGSGKSTLLHCLAGLDDLTSGRVLLGDIELTGLDDDRRTVLRRERVGFVFQTFNLVPTLTAAENIELPLRLAGRRPDPGWVANLAERLGISGRLRHRPSQLSGGEQQRVAVARAVVTRPDTVFADEPTGNLDSRAAGELRGLLRWAVDELHQTIVMVTHDPRAASVADRVVLLADGRIVDDLDHPELGSILDALRRLGS